jgi:hypothetical protein
MDIQATSYPCLVNREYAMLHRFSTTSHNVMVDIQTCDVGVALATLVIMIIIIGNSIRPILICCGYYRQTFFLLDVKQYSGHEIFYFAVTIMELGA